MPASSKHIRFSKQHGKICREYVTAMDHASSTSIVCKNLHISKCKLHLIVHLAHTMHEMAHAGSVKIPYSKVYGNIDGFVLKYSQWMPDDIKEKVTNAKAIFDEDAKDANADKLKKGILDYNIKYAKPTNETKTDSEESQDSDI